MNASNSPHPRPARSRRRHGKLFAAAVLGAAFAAALQIVVPSTPVSAAVAQAVIAPRSPDSFAELVKEVQPAVVNIATTSRLNMGAPHGMPQFRFPEGSPFERHFREFFGPRMPDGSDNVPLPEARSLGSGFIISPDGYVVTNNHVIHNAEEITVTLNDGDHFPAAVVGTDGKTDLALLKIEAGRKLPYVEFGDSDGARVGDWVIAVGSPFGLGGSVSAGIISARGRDIQSGPFDDYLQIDAPINRGNSGGPLFDRQGKVIGVNTAIYSPTGGNVGIGFAIPSSMAKSVIESLKDDGRVERGWLGVQIQAVTDEIAESLEMDDARGALVAGVEPGAPADAAGVRTGDVILEFDGSVVERMRDLPRMVAATKADESVSIRVLRDGKEKTMNVRIGNMPEVQALAAGRSETNPPDTGTGKLGLALAPLTPETRQRLRIPDRDEGVVIAEVERGSPAAREGLRPGDLIKRVGSRKVSSPKDVAEAVKHYAGRKAVLLLISRQGSDRFIAVPLDRA
ncbi:MAG: DegQ family serine endoprotease [Gammaproteobacteria bacterium]|nr:DegQ family serine endoprotease [Gammaproteobacteria bacterium]